MAPEMFGGVADVLHLELTNIGIMVLLGIQYASWILLLIFGSFRFSLSHNIRALRLSFPCTWN